MFHVLIRSLDDLALAWEALRRQLTRRTTAPAVSNPAPVPNLPAPVPQPMGSPLPPPSAPLPAADAGSPVLPPPVPLPPVPAPAVPRRDPAVTGVVLVRLGIVLAIAFSVWCFAAGNVLERAATSEPEAATVVGLREEGTRGNDDYVVTVEYADGRTAAMKVRRGEYEAAERGESVTVTASAVSGRPVRIDAADWSSRGDAENWTITVAITSVLLVAAMALVWFRVVPYVAADQRARIRRLVVLGQAGVVIAAVVVLAAWMLIERQLAGR